MRVRIIELKRLQNSVNGNPRWELITTHGNFKTLVDGSVNYEISPSWERRVVSLEIQRGVVVDAKLTRPITESACEICGRTDGLHDEEECFK